MRAMKSIQEIFTGRFAHAKFATVQKCDKSEKKNNHSTETGYTSSWRKLAIHTELVVLVFMDVHPREVWVGKFIDQMPDGQLFGFQVDKFELVGTHDVTKISDAKFYGKGRGGSARVNVVRDKATGTKGDTTRNEQAPPGEMIQRLVWLRKNHAKFKDPVWQHWGGKCAVTRSDCNSLLVASHIRPWSMSSPAEKTDVHNGLLLAASIDALFDRGLVSFSNDGTILFSSRLSPETAQVFGVRKGMKLDTGGLTNDMRGYLAWHREYYKFP